MKYVQLGFVSFFLIFIGCGGSGSDNSSSTPTAPPAPVITQAIPTLETSDIALFYPENAQVGQSISLATTAKNAQSYTQLSWQQMTGEQVTLLANSSQVVSFDLPNAGDYSFTLSARLSNGTNINETITVSVTEGAEQIANVRLDHVAPETGKVSLRVDGQQDKEIQAISWEQTTGAEASNLQVQDMHNLFFDAPVVIEDSLLTFEVDITYTDGTSANDSAYVLVQDVEINSDGYFPQFAEQIVSADVFAYHADSPHANALVDCVYNNQLDSSCRFSRLPLLGQENNDPSIDDVLDRLVVSHQWMGDRFKQFLQQSVSAPDMLKLLRATTAVVISYDVRPSFYWSATGAIYLDAANFWRTPEERDTLNDQPDFRSGFGNELQFIIPWRYVKNEQYYVPSGSYPVADRLEKSFADMEASIVWLMYHELGHANDFFPPTSWSSINSSDSPLSYANNNEPNSELFSSTFPLASSQMLDLADVSFRGEPANDIQKSYTADDITGFFIPDDASVYYSYSTTREDYANLFEAFMMAYRMQAYQDVAILSRVENPTNLVTWGQRSRFNYQDIQSRTRYVVRQVLPELNVIDIQNNLPATLDMRANDTWSSNLVLSDTQQQGKVLRVQPKTPWYTHEHTWHPRTPD